MASVLTKAALGAAAAVVTWKVVDGKYGISKDLTVALGAAGAAQKTASIVKRPNASIVMSWYETLALPGIRETPVFIQAETGRKMTFQELEDWSNRVGNWAIASGIQAGDCVALMMDNRPEYVALWLGMAKAGCSTALINTNLKGKPLVHAMTVSGSVGAVFGTEHTEVVEDIVDELRNGGLKFFASWGAGGMDTNLDQPAFADMGLDTALTSMSTAPVDESRRSNVKVTEPCYYIYTSGTTGLPKACNMSHAKVMALGAMAAMASVKQGDAIYGSGLPMYHSAANLGIGHAINLGSTYIIRAKFSASKQWEDCGKYGAVAMQYIGELCRYLLTSPAAPADKSHKLRVAFGNGLRPEIWDQFQRRFQVPEILEFYGATEGAGVLVNYCQNYQGQGAVGWAGPLMSRIMPASIVKFDVENEVPFRDPKTGFCVECAPNESGELLNPVRSNITTSSGELSNFEGYTNKEATEKKLLRDVFQKGDLWYRSGDLLRKDGGYFYFVDRIGDTFRWKGENVSTMEVSEVLSSFPGVLDANVYGAEVPGKDGRACMVAITQESGKNLDPVIFAAHCRKNLPSYSVPVFIRLLAEEINLTGTFKHQKVDYRNQGCNPTKVSDEMWWFNGATSAYEPYGSEQYDKIVAGQAKL